MTWVRAIDRDIARRSSSTDPDVQALVRDPQAQRELSAQARELRERTQLLAESMAEGFQYLTAAR